MMYPEKFPSGTRQWFTEISHVHAGEIIKSKGKFYLIRVSGAPHANPDKGLKDKGWLEINRLRWE